ncbi:MAG: hypothetical protein AB7S99_05030 [Pseudodonghicola sp.]
MLDILQLYVSGFWVWLGITVGIAVLGQAIVGLCAAIFTILRK